MLIVSTALLALNSYTKIYDLGELAQKHKQAANDLWLIREKYLSLLVDIAMKVRPLEALQEHRDKLAEQLHTVYTSAPSTTSRAYKKAQEALKKRRNLDRNIRVTVGFPLTMRNLPSSNRSQ